MKFQYLLFNKPIRRWWWRDKWPNPYLNYINTNRSKRPNPGNLSKWKKLNVEWLSQIIDGLQQSHSILTWLKDKAGIILYCSYWQQLEMLTWGYLWCMWLLAQWFPLKTYIFQNRSQIYSLKKTNYNNFLKQLLTLVFRLD